LLGLPRRAARLPRTGGASSALARAMAAWPSGRSASTPKAARLLPATTHDLSRRLGVEAGGLGLGIMLRTSSTRPARSLQGRDSVDQVLELVAVGGVQGGVVADRWRRLGVGFLPGHGLTTRKKPLSLKEGGRAFLTV